MRNLWNEPGDPKPDHERVNKPAPPRHETIIRIPALDKPDGEAVLHCSTAKSSQGGIYSQCNVQFNSANGLTSFEVFGDYRRHVAYDVNARATQKALADLHAKTFKPEGIGFYVREATEFYLNKAARNKR